LPANWKTAKPASAQTAGGTHRVGPMAVLFAAGLLSIGPHHPGSRRISKPKMKLLVLAQTPPPVHGQSIMVRTAVAGLPALGVPVAHVNLRLSRSAGDIGRWRPGKVLAILDACLQAIGARFCEGCDTLYYVPAPGKRSALWRDWLVMALCRPFYPRLVLHWHASGLADWLATRATAPERWLTRQLLGGATCSLVLDETLQADAVALQAKHLAVVPNGVADPGEPAARTAANPCQVLFLGLCSDEKGLFLAAEAVLAANRTPGGPCFTFVAAGSFPDDATRARFLALCATHTALRYVGPVHGPEKSRLYQTSHCLCLPTRYPAEGQPLVLLEAMAQDLPIVATRWRAIPSTLPAGSLLVEPGDVAGLTAALLALARTPPSAGSLRRHFLARYTIEHHLAALAAALKAPRRAGSTAR
jgi:glycosyltransferase involved in cell wall biosynthesis